MEVDVLSRLNYIRVWFMFSPGETWREVVTQLPFRQPKRRGRHEQSGHESAAGHMLTIATVALERHDGFSRAFVANRAATAAAGKWDFHQTICFIVNCVQVVHDETNCLMK